MQHPAHAKKKQPRQRLEAQRVFLLDDAPDNNAATSTIGRMRA
jgi:hypothetical protein